MMDACNIPLFIMNPPPKHGPLGMIRVLTAKRKSSKSDMIVGEHTVEAELILYSEPTGLARVPTFSAFPKGYCGPA